MLKDIFKQAYYLYTQNDLPTQAAALAYYTIFSLPPLLVILISLASRFTDENLVRNVVFEELTRQLGYSSAEEIYEVMNRIGLIDIGLGPSLIGAAVLFFVASTIFVTMRNGLNEIFKATPKRSGLVDVIFSRAIAITLILGLAFVLLAILLANSFLSNLENTLEQVFPDTKFLFLEFLNWWIPIVGPVSLFLLLFKILPEIKIKWKIAAAGAIFTSVLFTIGKRIVSVYISNSETVTVFSATGSIVAILVWIYYIAFIFYLGAVFTASVKQYFEKPAITLPDLPETNE